MFENTSENISIDSPNNLSTITEKISNNLTKNIKVICRLRPLNEKEKSVSSETTISDISEINNCLTFRVN